MKRLIGKVVVITGGANGIGLEAAKKFAKEGAQVILADYDQKKGEEAENNLQEQGYDVHFTRVDVREQKSVKDMVQDVIYQFKRIDILINNAGITGDAMLRKMDENQFKHVIDVNLTGVFLCAEAVLPIMLEQGKGNIINTSSVSGVYGNVGQTNYAASKAGIIGMTKTWAKELGRKGIRVNAVAPGFTETRMVKTVPDRVLNQLKTTIPLQRLGKPEDIANAYLFLASDESAYIHGHVLHVDGGIMM